MCIRDRTRLPDYQMTRCVRMRVLGYTRPFTYAAPGPREVGAKPTRSRHCKRGATRQGNVTGTPRLAKRAAAPGKTDVLQRSASQETWSSRGRFFSARETPEGALWP